MKVKLSSLVSICNRPNEYTPSLLEILGSTKGLSSVTAYRISKNIKAITEEEKTYQDTRIKMCKEYANKDEKGEPILKDNKYDIPDDKLKEFDDELKKLLDEEVDIEIKKLSLEEIDKVGLSAFDLSNIEFMLDLENKEDK